MSETININKKDLISILEEAYQQGCFGYLDLKHSFCKSKVDRLFECNMNKDSFYNRQLVSINSQNDWTFNSTNPYLPQGSTINGIFLNDYSTSISTDLSNVTIT